MTGFGKPFEELFLKCKESTRIQRLQQGVFIFELFSDADKTMNPASGVFLALCRGDIPVKMIARIMGKAFGWTMDEAADKVLGFVEQLYPFIDINSEATEPNQRYRTEQFSYKTIPLPENRRYSEPVKASLSLTNRCNFRCIYCYNGSGESTVKELEARQWQEAIRQLQEMGVCHISITGGEPTIVPGFDDIIETAVSGETLVSLFTNGFLLTDERIERLASHSNLLTQISLDSGTEDVHHYMTQTTATFGNVLESIRKMAAAGANLKVKAVVTPINFSSVESLIHRCEDAGVRMLTLDHYDFTYGGRGELSYLLSEEQNEAVKEFAGRYSRPDFSVYFSPADEKCMWESIDNSFRCDAATKFINLSPQGEYALCERLQGCEEFTIGRFPDMSIRQLWESHRPEEILHPSEESYTETCLRCEKFSICRSGCFAAKRMVGRPGYGPDPHCPRSDYPDNPFRRYDECIRK